MVKKIFNGGADEPDKKSFKKPSAKEHLFQVVDVYTSKDNPFKNGLPEDKVAVKCGVVGGEEEGRTLLQRLSLDENSKGFFATKIFLKAIGEPYKGENIDLDTDRWVGRQFYATVIHDGDYANIADYNFDKLIDQEKTYNSQKHGMINGKEIAWDE